MNLHFILHALMRASVRSGRLVPLVFGLLWASTLSLILLSTTAATQWMHAPPRQMTNVELTNATLPIFVNVAPLPDGQSMVVSGIGSQLQGQVFINATGNGGAQREFSYTDLITYSNAAGAYVVTLNGLWPQTNVVGTLTLTSTEQSSAGVEYQRAYIPAQTQTTLSSVDQIFSLSILFTDTFPAETYLAVTTNIGGFLHAPPPNYRFVGQVYTLRAAGLVYTTTQKMPLVFKYTPTSLGDLAPELLVIMAWNPATSTWHPLATTLLAEHQQVSTSVVTFTTYALMAAPLPDNTSGQQSWQDEFYSITNLDAARSSNVDIIRSGIHFEFLTLAYSTTQGVAVSQPITPSAPISAWQRLYYTATITPPTTTLTVDVLDRNGALLFANVASGFHLSTVDVAIYPALRLRANLTSTKPGLAPLLDGWRLNWQPQATATPTATPTATVTPIIPAIATSTPTATPTATREPTFSIYLPEVQR